MRIIVIVIYCIVLYKRRMIQKGVRMKKVAGRSEAVEKEKS